MAREYFRVPGSCNSSQGNGPRHPWPVRSVSDTHKLPACPGVSPGAWEKARDFPGEAQPLRSLQRGARCDVKGRRLPDQAPPLVHTRGSTAREGLRGFVGRSVFVWRRRGGWGALLPSIRKAPSLGPAP